MKKTLRYSTILSYIFLGILILLLSAFIYKSSRKSAQQLQEFCNNITNTNHQLHIFKNNIVLIQENLRKHILAETDAAKDSLEKVIDNYRLINEKIMSELLNDKELSEFNEELKELHNPVMKI